MTKRTVNFYPIPDVGILGVLMLYIVNMILYTYYLAIRIIILHAVPQKCSKNITHSHGPRKEVEFFQQ